MHISGGLGIASIVISLLLILEIFTGFRLYTFFIRVFLLLISLFISIFSYPKSALKVSRLKGVSLWIICYVTIWLSLFLQKLNLLETNSIYFL